MTRDGHILLGPWAAHAREAILAIDRQGRIAAWNPAATAVLGYSADEAHGRHVGFVLSRCYSCRHRERLMRELFSDDPEPTARELCMVHADGHELPVAVSPTRFAVDGEAYAALRFEDITDRKRLDAERMRLASFPELNPHPIFEVDLERRVTYQNDGARALAQSGWIDAILRRLGDLSELEATDEKLRFIDEFEHLGTWYELHTHPVIGWDRVRVYARDISVRKRADLALVAARDELGRRSQELEREVEDRKRAEQRAIDAARTKTMFLSYMSHELRTPLTAIIGYAQLLHGSVTDPDDRADLEMIERSAVHLVDIISDVLDLSKVEAGKMDVQVTDVSVDDLLDEVAGTAYGLMSAGDNSFTVRRASPMGIVRTDPVKLRQILLNLIGNAAKFTRRGSITLTVRAVHDGGQWMELAVTDTGIGMAPETVAGLFEPFAQGESLTTRRFRGTGLGLAICRELCELLGGRIHAESEHGQGSTFTVRLPLRPGRAPSMPAEDIATNVPRLRPQRHATAD